jgi:hypothetical protein
MQEDNQEKWDDILHLYNQLLLVNYSPGVALDRTQTEKEILQLKIGRLA